MLNKKLCIVSIYGPSVDDPSFFHAFFTALFEHLDCSLGLGGDPNFGLKEEMEQELLLYWASLLELICSSQSTSCGTDVVGYLWASLCSFQKKQGHQRCCGSDLTPYVLDVVVVGLPIMRLLTLYSENPGYPGNQTLSKLNKCYFQKSSKI